MIDLSPEAITARLREVSRLLHSRGFVAKQVDMAPPAVTARLRVMASLSDMCRQLARAGQAMRSDGSY